MKQGVARLVRWDALVLLLACHACAASSQSTASLHSKTQQEPQQDRNVFTTGPIDMRLPCTDDAKCAEVGQYSSWQGKAGLVIMSNLVTCNAKCMQTMVCTAAAPLGL
jgi:hypothetical protein